MTSKEKEPQKIYTYHRFDLIDGSHPLKDKVEKSYVDYSARIVEGGNLTYFNFELAKDMGLLPRSHPNKMNKKLKNKILDNFCIRIINEYDLAKKIVIPDKLLKKNKFMATRYLQMQHKNKLGQTSGDGRSIWNGSFKARGKTWDISSRGTGVTKLAPGSVESDTFLKTGNTEAGYGCGLAELDELYSSAILSEIFHNKGIATERMLAVIETPDGYGIGVRAGMNLLRPAHTFMYLRQNDLSSLKKIAQYYIERQVQNGMSQVNLKSRSKYQFWLQETAMNFGEFCAQLEREYIFMWLDWDGDNVLCDGGIIDYGSIRQFGMRHEEYRYDDVIKMSTNLKEQVKKGRFTVQVFCQLVDYIETGNKKLLSNFDDHPAIKLFDESYSHYLRLYFLNQIGFSKLKSSQLMLENEELVDLVYKQYVTLEKTKTSRGIKKVDDGVHRPAIYNMRRFLLELPQAWNSALGSFGLFGQKEALNLIIGEDVNRRDRRLTPLVAGKIYRFQKSYERLILRAMGSENRNLFMENLITRSKSTNRQDRLTGNGLIYAVDELQLYKKKGKLASAGLQKIISEFIKFQSEVSGDHARVPFKGEAKKLYLEMVNIAELYKESI